MDHPLNQVGMNICMILDYFCRSLQGHREILYRNQSEYIVLLDLRCSLAGSNILVYDFQLSKARVDHRDLQGDTPFYRLGFHTFCHCRNRHLHYIQFFCTLFHLNRILVCTDTLADDFWQYIQRFYYTKIWLRTHFYIPIFHCCQSHNFRLYHNPHRCCISVLERKYYSNNIGNLGKLNLTCKLVDKHFASIVGLPSSLYLMNTHLSKKQNLL